VFTITPPSQQITWLNEQHAFIIITWSGMGWEKIQAFYHCLAAKPDILVGYIPALLQVMTVLMT
jgi:hypothetical protein